MLALSKNANLTLNLSQSYGAKILYINVLYYINYTFKIYNKIGDTFNRLPKIYRLLIPRSVYIR